MKRLFAFAALLSGLVVAAALGSGSAVAVRSAAPTIPSHVGGVVPTIGKQVSGSGNLINHGGPTMTTNTTYAIYWAPSGYSFGPGYTSTINQFFGDVSHDSGLSSNVYAVTTQYSGIQYSSTFGASVVDTHAFPSSGCSLYAGDISECLTDSQVIAEVDRVITAQGWMRSGSNMFFVFTPIGVGSCFDDGSACAYTGYCAYHGHTASGAIYANQPYAKHSGCDQGQYPNGNDADPTINVVSHEHIEAITDPQLNAWYDAAGYEIGDKCAWDFGTLSGTKGAKYNQTINTHHYFMQREYSNDGSACVQTYGGSGGGAPQITNFSPTSGRHGKTVKINGTNFTGTTAIALVRGGSTYPASYTVVSNTRIKATVPNAGVGNANWKVTNPSGSTTSSAQFNVTG
jgi:IPT/TIG domain